MSGHTIKLTGPDARMRARRIPRAPDDPARWKTCELCGRRFQKDKRNTWAYWEKARFCGKWCRAAAWSVLSTARRPAMREAFERWIDKSGDCWVWTGACDKDGYGAFNYAGKTRRAPVVALELDGRKPVNGQYACHHCDNPSCVRPDHLYPGTPTQNMADAAERGRTCQGEKQHMAKLTAEDVRNIRASRETDVALAKQYGVERSNISMVRTRRTWRHVP